MRKLILLFVFLIANLVFANSNDSIITLKSNKEIIEIGRQIYLLEDKENKLTIDDILKPEYQKLFQLSKELIPNFNTTASNIWVKFTVENQTDEGILLELAQPMAWYIDFYKPDSNGKLLLATETGMMRPLSHREVDNNFFLFELSKNPQPQTYYFSIQSEFPINLPLTLGTAKSLYEKNYPSLLFFGMISGFFIVMFFYNLFIYFSVRDNIYLYYCGYLITGLYLINFVSGNYGYAWNLVTYYPNYLIAYFAFVPFDVFFLLKILKVKRQEWFFRITFVVLAFTVFLGLANLYTGHYIDVIDVFQITTLSYYIYVFLYSVFLYHKGKSIARFIFLGYSFYLVGVVIYVFQNFGILPTNFFTYNSILIGTSIEVCLFSFALGDRINEISKEKENTQLALLTQTVKNEILVKEQNLLLEQRVIERTQESELANKELVQAQEQALAKSRLLEAIAKINSLLLEENDWKYTLAKGFDLIGNAIDVDRVYFFSRVSNTSDDIILVSQQIEWTKPEIPSEADNPDLQSSDIKAFGEIANPLLNNETFEAIVSLLPDGSTKEILKAQGILSIVIVPIFINRVFQGFIGFDDCTKERMFLKEEINILQTLSSNLATTIQRKNYEKELLEKEKKFRHLFEGSNDAIMMLTPQGFTDCNEATLNLFRITKEEFTKTHPANLSPEFQPDGRTSSESANEKIQLALKDGFARFEWMHRKATGEDFFAEVLLSPYQENTNLIIQATVRDISERKNAENLLAESENKLRGILDSMQESNVLIGADFRVLSFNKIVQQNIKAIYKKEIQLGEDFRQYIVAGTEEGFYKDFQTALQGEIVSLEMPLKFGEFEQWFSFTYYPVYDQNNNIMGVSFNTSEITSRKNAELELRTQKTYIESLLNAIPDLVFVLDADGIFQEYKAGSEEDLMISPSMFLGKKCLDVLPPFLAVPMMEKIHSVLQNRSKEKLEYQLPVENKLFDYEARFSLFGDNQVIALVQNITDRKNAEAQIIKSQKDLLRIGQVAKVGGWEYDVPNNKLTWTEVTYDIHEMPYDFIPVPEPAINFFKEGESRETIRKVFTEAIVEGKAYDVELVILTATGKEVWVRAIGEPVMENGKCVRILGVFQDIHEHKLAEEKITQSEAKLQSILNEVEDVIWSVRMPDFKTILVSPSVEKIYGYSVDDWINDSSIAQQAIYEEDKPLLREMFASLETQSFFDAEYRIVTKQGQIKWIQNKAKIILDENQHPIRLDGVVSDITLRKQTEAQILKQQQDLIRVGEIAKVGGWEYDLVKNKITWEKIIYDIHELPYTFEPTVESVIGFYKEGRSREQIGVAINKAFQEGIGYDLDLQLVTATGREIWVRALGMAEFNNHTCTKLFGVFQDITEQKLAEEKIRDSQRELQNFFDLNTDFMTIANTQGYLEIINPTFERELGYTKEELLSQPFLNLVHPDDMEATLQEIAKLSEGAIAINFENRYRKKDGEYIWLSWRAAPDIQTGKLFANARDITFEKKMQKLMHLNLILKDRPNINQLGSSKYFDNLLKGLLDITESEYGFLGEVFYENDEPYLKTYVLTNISWDEQTKKFYEKNSPTGLEFRNLDTLFGYALKHKTIVISNNPAKDPRRGGLPKGHPDLNAFLGIPILDVKDSLIGMIGIANKKGGYSEKDAQFLETFLDSFANIIQTFQSERKRLEVEVALQKQNIRLLESEEELKENLEELAAQKDYLNRTLEELRSTQEQIIRSEKLAVMGKLVASVAHEINTPLGAINASAGNMALGLQENLMNFPKLFQVLNKEEQDLFFQVIEKSLQNNYLLSTKEERQIRKKIESNLLELQIPNASELASKLSIMGVQENFSDFLPLLTHSEAGLIFQIATQLNNQQKSVMMIQTAVEKASKVVFALKTYVRQDNHQEKTKTRLQENLETVLTLYHGQMRQSVEVERKFEDVPEVFCYVEELNQVWTNLIHNALQAMHYDGKLFVGIKKIENQIEVSIKDTGPGIPESIQDKIFEPFFTTKRSGEGTGLGLDIVKKIIEKHNGRIWFESKEGVGTEFKVRIPIEN